MGNIEPEHPALELTGMIQILGQERRERLCQESRNEKKSREQCYPDSMVVWIDQLFKCARRTVYVPRLNRVLPA